ncbi:hypothetical protein HDZ31DRAFT_44665, partial [Schizophyllum fasciatum]
DALDLPELEEARLRQVNAAQDGDPFRSLYGLILRSMPPLRILESRDIDSPNDFLLSSLGKVDQLVSLTVIEQPKRTAQEELLTDAFIFRLFSKSVAPKLEQMELIYASEISGPTRVYWLQVMDALKKSREGCRIHIGVRNGTD